MVINNILISKPAAYVNPYKCYINQKQKFVDRRIDFHATYINKTSLLKCIIALLS